MFIKNGVTVIEIFVLNDKFVKIKVVSINNSVFKLRWLKLKQRGLDVFCNGKIKRIEQRSSLD